MAASSALLIPSEILAMESCGSEIYDAGYEVVKKDNGLNLISTEIARARSDLKEDFVKALYEAESTAKIKILRWLKTIGKAREIEVDGKRSVEYISYHPVKISEPPGLAKQLSQMVVMSKCHINHQFVQVRVEFSLKP